MTSGWWVVILVGVITILFKSFGPVVLGGRELPPRLARFSGGVPAAVLAALITVQTVGGSGAITVDARLAGVAAAGVVLALERPLWMALTVAAGVTALVRWLM